MSELEKALARYLQGRTSRRGFIGQLTALGIGSGFIDTLLGPSARALAAGPRQMVPSHAPYVVVVVMDAFRADYLNLAPMPNLEWIMQRGVFFSNAWVGQLESYTPVSHATISTGATPAHQGVIGFDWRDPASGEETYTAWYNDVIAGRLEQQLTQHGVNSIPAAVKRADPAARVVTLSSEKYYAADAMGGAAADYIIYGLPKGSTITPQGIPHHVPPESYLNLPDLTRPWPLKWEQYDELSMTMALEALPAFDPRVLMINLPGPDVYGHRYGGPARLDVMRRLVQGIDAQLGRLIKALQDRNILDETVLVVAADHGMVQNTYQIGDDTIKKAIRAVGGEYLFHSGGNSAFIWLRNPQIAPVVANNLVTTLQHAPFAYCQTVESGAYVHHLAAGTVDPDLDAAYQYLLGTFAGPLAPDITLAFEEDTITRWYPDTHGEHGGATAGAQRIPLIISGPGARSNVTSPYPARLMDVAPTILTLLGIEPTNMDGVVLTDALLHPTDAQLQAQDELQGRLLAYQKALDARSAADISAQNPPTELPPHPPRQPNNPQRAHLGVSPQ